MAKKNINKKVKAEEEVKDVQEPIVEAAEETAANEEVEASETVVGMDRNMDGIVADETDQSGQQPSEQPTGGVTEDEQ